MKPLNLNYNTNGLYKTNNLNLNLNIKNDQTTNLFTNKSNDAKKLNNIDFSLINLSNSTSTLTNDLATSLNTSNNNNVDNKNVKHYYYDGFKNKKQLFNQNQRSIDNSHEIKFNIPRQNNLKQLHFLTETSIYKLPEMKTHDGNY